MFVWFLIALIVTGIIVVIDFSEMTLDEETERLLYPESEKDKSAKLDDIPDLEEPNFTKTEDSATIDDFLSKKESVFQQTSDDLLSGDFKDADKLAEELINDVYRTRE